MDSRKKLFSYKAIYDIEGSNKFFLNAMKSNVDFHRLNCPDYDKILTHHNFSTADLRTIEDIHLIPPIPTMFYKAHELMSLPEKKLLIKSTTSGTKGAPTTVGLDFKSCYYGAAMIYRTISYHKLFSAVPVNYILLGYEPSKHNTMGAVKTAYGSTFLAPALHREYALKSNGKDYYLNVQGIEECLIKYAKSNFPVRLVGFPSYLYFMLKTMEENNIRLKLNKKSRILLGGGWKQHFSEKVDKPELYEMAYKTLGIKEEQIKEFFAVVESNVLYCDCKNHHFHVPVYGRVLIRDAKTFQPVPYGTPGLLNLLSPLVGSMPLGSIVTDDIAILHEGKSCGCGIESPYFEILGRVGLSEIKTCAAAANAIMQEVE